MAAKQADLAKRLRERDDRYAQLVGKAFHQQFSGMESRSSSTLDDEERAELAALEPAAFVAYQLEVTELTEQLRELVAQAHPLELLALIKMSNLMAHGEYYEPTHQGLESTVELVAGLLLTQPPAAASGPPGDGLTREIYEHIAQLHDVVVLRNLAAQHGEDPERAELRFTSTVHWMTLRGTSFEQHGTDLARAIYGPFDEWCLEHYGFTVDDVLRVGAAAHDRSTTRFDALIQEAYKHADAVKATLGDHALRDKLNVGQLARLDAPGVPARFGFAAFMEVVGGGMQSALTFTVDDIVEAGVPKKRAEAVLRELSISVGALDPGDYGGLFDRSPLVERPFVEFQGPLILPVPGMVLRDTAGLLEARLMRGPRSFSKSRAKTLDALAVEYLTALLPRSKGFVNLFYDGAELDGLVIFERMAFVVEGKGTPLSVPAQRGDLERLRRDIGRAVEAAWHQGTRAKAYILSNAPAVFVDDAGQEAVRFEPGEIDDVIVVNPTLHDLAGHASQLPRLRQLGLFAEGEYPWSVFINDLRVISETAGNPAVFLHYLVWRARLPLGERITVADELDLWGSYLLCERFGSLADAGHYVVGNSTTDFDAYYNGLLGNGPSAPKPGKMLEEPVKGFVERMANDRPPGWLDEAGTCLDLSIPELAYVCGRATRVTDEAHAGGESAEEIGRVRLVGVPRGRPLREAIADAEPVVGDATFHIYLQASDAGPTVVAARTVRPITFELSEYERFVLQQVPDAR